MYKNLLANREEKWSEHRAACAERMTDLAEVFGSEQPKLSRVRKNSKLESWFRDREAQIKTLSIEEPQAAGI